MKVEIEAKKLILVTENHGGYLAGKCLYCDSHGWIEKDDLQYGHRPGCPVPEALKHNEG